MAAMPKALVVTHDKSVKGDFESVGRLPALLTRRGYALDWVCPPEGEALPDSEQMKHEAIVIVGGMYMASDYAKYGWMASERDWITRCVKQNSRILAICFGASLLASALGANLCRDPEGFGELGYYPIQTTARARGLLPDRLHAYLWHQEGFLVPEGGELLAYNERFNQAFRYGNRIFGFQFHPEMNREIIRRWLLVVPPELIDFLGSQPKKKQLEDALVFDPLVDDWFDNFLNHWLEQ